jgi:hypothetical protein
MSARAWFGTKASRVIAAGVLSLGAVLSGAFGADSAGGSGSGLVLVGYGSSVVAVGPVSGVEAVNASTLESGRVTRPASFDISGATSGLYPGRTASLVLVISNVQKVSITVTSITTTVGNASAQCLAANVKVTSFIGHQIVPAGGKAHVIVEFAMAHSAPNSCQGGHFSFEYQGLGTA